MKMHGPGEYRIPNTMPMIHTTAIPPAVTEIEYHAILLIMLGSVHALSGGTDPAYAYNISQLEDTVIAAGLTLPIVRRAEHEQPTDMMPPEDEDDPINDKTSRAYRNWISGF